MTPPVPSPDIPSPSPLSLPSCSAPPRDISPDETERRKELIQAGKEHEIGFVDTEHVKAFELDEDYIQSAESVLSEQNYVPDFWREKYFEDKGKYWDLFYKNVTDKFWKDRSWLLREFPPISPFFDFDATAYGPEVVPTNLKREEVRIKDRRILLEVGCGTGATIFPAIARNPRLLSWGFDVSQRAITSLNERWSTILSGASQEGAGYDEAGQWIGGALLGGSVWDITEELEIPTELKEARKEIDLARGLDHSIGLAEVVCLIFCLSAVPPAEQRQAAKRVAQLLAPGGTLCIRDYGRYDELQLKFARSKTAKTCEENCYVRGDNTLQYYWTIEELDDIFVDLCGLKKVESKYILREFTNRKSAQILKRVWVQAMYQREE